MPSVASTRTSRSRSDAARAAAQPASRASLPPATRRAGDDPAEPREPADAPKLDGRRVHIVDRALDYVALAATGLSAARIARKRRRSAGYVSILLRLGHAIRTLEPAELAALRSPRITWKLAQRIVRTDADVGSIRHQLRLALGGFSTHNMDRRKNRVRRAAPGTGGAAGGESTARPGAAWGWDESWFTRDPIDYVRHHLTHLATLHRTVDARAQRLASLHSARRLSVGQSLGALRRSLAAAQQLGASSDSLHHPELRAVAALAVIERHLTAAREAMDALLTGGDPTPVPAPRVVRTRASASEIEEDLA
jgi:hypothetical protein